MSQISWDENGYTGATCDFLRNNPEWQSHCQEHFANKRKQEGADTTRYKSYTSTFRKQRTHPAHMYDFSRMKQDGKECHLLRTADAEMGDACEKHFQMSRGTPTSVARKQTSTAVEREPYKKRTGSRLSARNDSVPRTVPPVLAEHHHRKLQKRIPISDAITVLSANFAWEVHGYTERKNEKVEYLTKNANNADAIFLQESPTEAFLKRRLNWTPYEVVVNVANSKWDTISVLLRQDSPPLLMDSNFTDTEKDATPCFTHRINVIVTLRHKDTGKQMHIGYAHLCGGGPDESRHRNDSTELITNIKTYTIQTMIDQGSDIILGDFNSDQLGKNAVFLRQSGWSDEQMQLWNSVPYKLLIANGYALETPENSKTSVHGGFVDSIWYRGVELIDTGAIDLITGGWSDHNAVYATLM